MSILFVPLKSLPKLVIRLTSPSTRAFSVLRRNMAQEYKLKGITRLDLKNGEKREVEVEGVEDGTILLANVGNRFHAMSAKCTHYGAPLKNGVLTPEGRLVCPWHGACFNVASGDVEDAPALDPIAKFELVERDGSVYIKAEEQVIKAQRKSFNPKCSSQSQEKVVVVGGGSGAMGLIEALRKSSYTGSLTVISSEDHVPIDRTKLSKALIGDPSKIQLRSEDWFKDAGVTRVTDTVTGIDFNAKSVSTAKKQQYPYTKLVLATGGTPRKLPLPGFKELKNIFPLRSISDVQSILAILGNDGEKDPKRVVVIGSGFIGLEVGNALAGKKHKVTIIGMESTPLERVMGPEVGKVIQSALSKNGVGFRMDASVEAALPSATSKDTVGAIKLKDGTSIPADIVVLGVGVSPETGYLKGSIDLQKDGSVLVDESFVVQAEACNGNVFAIGDIATHPYHGPGSAGSLTRIEHWNVAQNSGRSVAATIAASSEKGQARQPTEASTTKKSTLPIPIFWSALGSQLRYCGNTPNGWDECTLQGQPDNGKFAAFYAKGDEVVAVASMMMDPVMTKSSELMRLGKMPGFKQIRAGLDVTDVEFDFDPTAKI